MTLIVKKDPSGLVWEENYVNRIICGDALAVLRTMPDGVIQTCITSPPYWGLRDYGVSDQLGLEKTPDEYVAKMVAIFQEVRRVLKDDGTLWLNLGDCYASNKGGKWDEERAQNSPKQTTPRRNYAQQSNRTINHSCGFKPKDLVGIPWVVAFALRADRWYLRSDIIWSKPNPMPESVKDRPTRAHEYIFLMSKSARYYYDAEAIAEDRIYSGKHKTKDKWPDGWATGTDHTAVGHSRRKRDKQRGHSRRHVGFNDRWDQMTREDQCCGKRNKRTVWEVATQPFAEAHFATYPEKLIEPCILAGSRPGDIVLDPFFGSGTTGKRAKELGRRWIGIELNPDYCALAHQRLCQGEVF